MRNHFLIKNIYAREINNSRGYPTVEVEVLTDSGVSGSAIVPLNYHDDNNSATEIYDKDVKRYNGYGATNVVNIISNTLAKELIGINVIEQRKIDNYLNFIDGTKNKSSIGANTILGVSMATARAAANTLNIPLYMYIGGISGSSIPVPMMSILNYDDVKEVLIVPRNIESYTNMYRACVEVYNDLENVLNNADFDTWINNKGEFCPKITEDYDALNYVMKAIEKAGYINNFAISLDINSNAVYKNGKYSFFNNYSSNELIELYKDIVEKYPILSIEDALEKGDWDGWKKLTNELGNKIHLIGNELFSTNISKLSKGVQSRTANSISIQPIQVGTITETIDVVKYAKANGYMPIMSNSLYETEDTFISDFAVALNIRYIKCGAPNRGENVAKYNQLLRIEENFINLNEK